MNVTLSELPRYRCHKVVHAAKITGIEIAPSADGMTLVLGDVGSAVHVSDAWHEKNKPIAGGYYVLYNDGYESFSPARAFEEGYTILPKVGDPGTFESAFGGAEERPTEHELHEIATLVGRRPAAVFSALAKELHNRSWRLFAEGPGAISQSN